MDQENNNTEETPQPEAPSLNRRFEKLPPVQIPKPVLVNGIPISHKADGSDLPAIQQLIDKVTQPEEDETPPEPPKPARKPKARPIPQPKVVEVEPEAPAVAQVPEKVDTPTQGRPVKKLSGKNAIQAFKQAVNSARIPVKLYSVDDEVTLRELTVTDQKTLSKTALINNSRRDVIYTSQCAMINGCVETEGFDIQNYTEFDRIAILLRLYEQNYFKNEVKYTCPVCHKENVYQLDFSKILNKVRKAWVPDRSYVMTHGDKEFHITAGWPKVSTISEFYTNYYKQYQNTNQKTQNTIDQLSNVEYLVMFIKAIDLVVSPDEVMSIDLSDLSYDERTDLIDSLPQGIIFDDTDGVISRVISDFTDPLNKAFQYEKCQFCGHETEEGVGSIADFT